MYVCTGEYNQYQLLYYEGCRGNVCLLRHISISWSIKKTYRGYIPAKLGAFQRLCQAFHGNQITRAKINDKWGYFFLLLLLSSSFRRQSVKSRVNYVNGTEYSIKTNPR